MIRDRCRESTVTSAFFAGVWPPISANDSDSLRRRKYAVRTGHLAMVGLILASVGSSLLTAWATYSRSHVLVLAVASMAYTIWNLTGTRGLVTLVLWDQGAPPPIETRAPQCGRLLYFVVQVSLAGLVYALADRGRIPNLVWLGLLPPVAYAVFLLEWRGITVISLLMMSVLVLSFYRWHGAGMTAYAALAFSFAILFTLVFTLLAVHSEKARNEVQRLASELGEANRQLREYAVQAQELSAAGERNRIAREIHDSLGHYLTVANVQMEAARALWATNPNRALEALAKAQSFTQEGLQDVRRSVAALRASPLDGKSLVDALRILAASADSPETPAAFQVMGQPRQLAPPVELSLYRAAQEGLTNSRKHSQAKHLSLALHFQPANKVTLEVADDGVGAQLNIKTAGFGLMGLRERAHLLGGELRLQTAPHAGFHLAFEVPA